MYYAIAKDMDGQGGGVLLRSLDGVSSFKYGQKIIPNLRHAAILKKKNSLMIFFSRGEDRPERILAINMTLEGHWEKWQLSDPVPILSPEKEYEGGNLSLGKSKFGAIHSPVRQLRDPAIFVENGKTYLIYACAGESALGMAQLINKI